MRRVINLLNIALFVMCAYVYGFYSGMNQPQVDRAAINEAVYMAMMER